MHLLSGWYPGLGEVEKIRRMSPIVQDFISDASAEDPRFVDGYLLPALQGDDPEGQILSDLQDALCDLEFENAGLGGMGNLGKSFLKRVTGAIRRVHKKIAHVILPKPLQKIEEKAHKIATKTGKKVAKAAGKIAKKYGNIILMVAGAVLAPFTGGASLAVASLLTTANTVYQKKAAARKAKAAAAKNANQLVAEAQQQQDQAGREMDQFYSQNQKWFVDNLGLTPDKWAKLTFEQKVDILQHGMSGTVPGSAPASQEPGATSAQAPGTPTAGGGYGTPSGGGGGGGESAQPGGAPGGPGAPGDMKVATASMFDGAMVPMLIAGVALAAVFGKPVKGGSSRRRSKRNPGTRRWRVA